MPGDQDSALVAQCLEGDLRAFGSLVDKYQKVVYNAALRMGAGRENAEDITQTVFLKVYEGLARYNPRYKFFSWLYRIAVNETLNATNRNRRFEPIEPDLVADEHAPEKVVQDNELRGIVQDCLMGLSVQQRAAIVLSHFHGLSYAEIGYILDIPEKTVKSRLFTARSVLRELLLRNYLEKEDDRRKRN